LILTIDPNFLGHPSSFIFMELFLLPLKKEKDFSGFHWDKKASPYTYS